ncbi:GNAT family N-acetyltransferase [Marinicellulosiphila megalodicopiae]|uniref:GNAT family N-acetyltransferase n=1 Tax=Marinicellulosiphila megalodicopiae TaxID=2724896 RepID=UPI003BB0B0E0
MIREANKNDALNLAALSIQVWLNTYAVDGVRNEISKYVIHRFTEHYFLDQLNQNNLKTLVFVEDDLLLGYITIDLDAHYIDVTQVDITQGYEITTLYVQSQFKGKGIGKKLLGQVQTQFGNTCWLTAWVFNENAIGFYKHIGFKDIGMKHFELEGELHENRILAFVGD